MALVFQWALWVVGCQLPQMAVLDSGVMLGMWSTGHPHKKMENEFCW